MTDQNSRRPVFHALRLGFFFGVGLFPCLVGAGWLLLERYRVVTSEAAKAELANTEKTLGVDFSDLMQHSIGILNAPKFNEKSGLEIMEHKRRPDASGLSVVGRLVNRGETPWSSVSLQMEVKDAQGELITVAKEYVTGTLKPGDSRPFEVSVYKSKLLQRDPEELKYEMKITDARAEP